MAAQAGWTSQPFSLKASKHVERTYKQSTEQPRKEQVWAELPSL